MTGEDRAGVDLLLGCQSESGVGEGETDGLGEYFDLCLMDPDGALGQSETVQVDEQATGAVHSSLEERDEGVNLLPGSALVAPFVGLQLGEAVGEKCLPREHFGDEADEGRRRIVTGADVVGGEQTAGVGFLTAYSGFGGDLGGLSAMSGAHGGSRDREAPTGATGAVRGRASGSIHEVSGSDVDP